MLSGHALRGTLLGLVLVVSACQSPRSEAPEPEAPARAAIPQPAQARAHYPLRYQVAARREIAPGIEWMQVKGTEKGHPVFVNVVSVDPRDPRYRLMVVPSEGPGPTRRESTRRIARRHQALAAINGSYFHFNDDADGRPIGLVKVSGAILSDPRGDRPALGVAPDGTAFFGTPRRLTASEQRERLARSIRATPAPPAIWQQWLRDLTGGPRPAKAAIKPPAPVLSEPWDEARFALEGGPLIVQGGAVAISGGFDGYILNAREPRTAVGLTPEGRVLMVTVDGRVPGHSKGIALKELAQLFLELGATEALNWDGGGSTTMMVRDQLVSRVATGWCRPVSNALILVEASPSAAVTP